MKKNRILKEYEKDKIKEKIKYYFPELLIGSEKYEEIKTFFENYLIKRRDSITAFENNIMLTFSFFSCIGFNNYEIYNIILNNSGLIHMNNMDLLHRLLIVARLNNGDNDDMIRFSLLKRSKDFITGPDNAYARIKYLEEMQQKRYLKFKGDNPFTMSTIFHCSNTDFEKRFGISKEELMFKYPFYFYDEDGIRHILPAVLEELITWPGNQELLDSFFGKNNII